jgi:hypothetical protein
MCGIFGFILEDKTRWKTGALESMIEELFYEKP